MFAWLSDAPLPMPNPGYATGISRSKYVIIISLSTNPLTIIRINKLICSYVFMAVINNLVKNIHVEHTNMKYKRNVFSVDI